MYRRQPSSRVFAPLAESYRKLGMLDEAYKVLREGIKRHPSYVLGYLVLAHCYYDQRKTDLTYQTLHPLVESNRDNLSLQKLFAQVCLDLGLFDEALETFKFLLFMNPKDDYISEQVRKLENDLNKDRLISKKVILKSPQAENERSQNEDEWSIVTFSHDNTQESGFQSDDNWEVKKHEPAEIASNDNDWQIMSRSIDDDFFSDEDLSPEDSELPIEAVAAQDTFFASHTLVDLYISQNYMDSAIDLLEKIIANHPKDIRSIQKLRELKETQTLSSNDKEHDEIMRIIHDKVQRPELDKLQQAYRLFLQHIQLQADEKNSNL